MSRAFVKEGDGEGEELAELQVSPHRNLVTPAGQRQIEDTVERLRAALSDARAADDRAAIKRAQRDLRYWTERRRTAEAVEGRAADRQGAVRIAGRARTGDGARVNYQIVGEDEADPANGRISYVSPIARLMIGRAAGDEVELPDGAATIVTIQ